MNKTIFLIVLALPAWITLWGQHTFYQTLGNKQGLSQSSAVAFWQDHAGRIWIGNDALNCFNGDDVDVYRISENIPEAEDSDIHAISGNDSILTFLSANSLLLFDLATEQFFQTGITTYSYCILQDKLYYVSSDGELCAFNWRTYTSAVILHLPDHIQRSDCMIEAAPDVLWIGTPSGIQVVDLAQQKVTETYLPGERIVSLYKDSQMDIWIATLNHRIYLYNPDQGIHPLAITNLDVPANDYFPNSLYCVQEDAGGTIWIGTLIGVYKLVRNQDRAGFTLTAHTLQESSVYALFSDRQGTIWIGSYYGDVRYYNPLLDNYTYYSTDESNPLALHGAVIGQMAVDKHGNKYFATEGSGINVLKTGSNVFEHITTANGLPQNKVRDLWYDEEYDRLFVSTYMEGLCYLDLKSGTIRRFPQGELKTIYQLIVENILPYQDGLLLHTQDGVFKLDRKTLAIDYFFPEGELRDRCSSIIRTLYIDDKKTMWVSSYQNGLFCVDLKQNKIIRDYGNSSSVNSRIPSDVLSICGDSRRGIYLATMKAGVLKYIPEADTFLVFDEEKHLLSNICYDLALTDRDKLIVTSDKGLTLMEISVDNTVRSFYHMRINQASPLTAFIGDCGLYVSKDDGRIYAGCLYGLLCFSERDLQPYQSYYTLYFNSLNINNETIHPGAALLVKSLHRTDKLVLPHDKNTFSLTFASSNYLASRTSAYEYMMVGLEDIWTKINHKTIIYNSLRPGSYKLIVREVANPARKAEIDLVVKSPFWATFPAILVYLILIVFIAGWLVRSYKSRMLLQATLEVERHEIARIEESNRHKMDFFVNISNEFRTPLTLILSLLEMLPQDLPQGGKSKIEKIKRNASHLQSLISEMLDFRKMGQNKLLLKLGNYDLSTLLFKTHADLSDYAVEKHLVFRFTKKNDSFPVWIDQYQMQKVFYNLLFYVLKNSSPKDVIDISIRQTTGFQKVQISHKCVSGKEGDWKALSDILLDTAPVTDISTLPDGMIGLAFCKGIVELHKGVLSVDATAGKLVLCVSLPLGVAHFNADDINAANGHSVSQQSALLSSRMYEDNADSHEHDGSIAQTGSYRMLLVEDDYEMRKLLEETFSMMYDVAAFDDANEAYRYAVEEQPDIVVCEINLPGLSGLEMCSMLKSNLHTSHLPVILLSEQPSEEQNMESIKHGADYYFVKPFNIRILFLRCNYLVKDRKKMLQQMKNNTLDTSMATNKKEKEFLEMINEIVEENWEDPSFDTTVWHERLRMGRTRFFQQVKEITGMTPNDYLLYLKMNKGRQLLNENREQTVAETAYKLGFNSPAYFSKCFKKQFGITPQDYKRERLINY